MSLFKETAGPEKGFILYTFEEARQLFIECNDPTGYMFATTYLGGWKHWLALKNSPSITEELDSWEEELQIKLRAESVANMIILSTGDKGYQANKFLVDGGWIKKGAGRPTKASVKKAIRQKVTEYDEFKNVVDLGKGS